MKKIITLISAVLALGVLTPSEAQAGRRSCYSGHRGNFRISLAAPLISYGAFSGGHCYRPYDYSYYNGYSPYDYGYSYPRYTVGYGYRSYPYSVSFGRSYGYGGYRSGGYSYGGYRYGHGNRYGCRPYRYRR